MIDSKIILNSLVELISEGLGLDLSDPNLADTPSRISEMYQDIFQNVGKEFPEKLITWFPNDLTLVYPTFELGVCNYEPPKSYREYNQLILLPKIQYTSWCAHHFLPFSGDAWFGYIPKDKLVGASKPARLMEWYSKRPQMQETLCNDVINRFDEVIKPQGTILLIYGVHDCMKCRGVKSSGGMFTSAVSGVLSTDAKARSEAMDLIKISMGLK